MPPPFYRVLLREGSQCHGRGGGSEPFEQAQGHRREAEEKIEVVPLQYQARALIEGEEGRAAEEGERGNEETKEGNARDEEEGKSERPCAGPLGTSETNVLLFSLSERYPAYSPALIYIYIYIYTEIEREGYIHIYKLCCSIWLEPMIQILNIYSERSHYKFKNLV